MRWLDDITDSVDMSLISSRSWGWIGRPGVLQSMGLQRVGQDLMTEKQQYNLTICRVVLDKYVKVSYKEVWKTC